jgi:hypothetical protein
MGRTLETTRVVGCPKCAQRLRIGVVSLGKKARCAGCDTVFRLPKGETRGPTKKAEAQEPVHHREKLETSPRPWRGRLYWLITLAFLPLALMVVRPTSAENDLRHRFARTLASASPDVALHVERLMHSRTSSLDDILALLPDDRVEGAYLPRSTMRHWLFGAESTILFLVVLPLFSRGPRSTMRPSSS